MQLRIAHVKIRKVVIAATMEAFRFVRWEGTLVSTLPKNPGDAMAGGAETTERDMEQIDPLAEEQSEPLDTDRAMVLFWFLLYNNMMCDGF
mmetsp:Transcript_30945/g.64861  ORF Transcript_30945/g.64861 Transcript_30945/m.64861 type:complete len:91 (+) Transcript_30945:127-399(+)